MLIGIYIIDMMKIRENVIGEGGEEDWWRKKPENFARVCNSGGYCRQPDESNSGDIRESVLYATLFEGIHRGFGPLKEFFGPNTAYAEFKKICQQDPAAKKACVSQYRLLKSMEKN
jgi:hypothetical protein